MRTRIGLAFIAAVAGCCGAAQAGPTPYSYFYVAGSPSYAAAPGATISVPLYLQEVNHDGSKNSLLTNEDGLDAAGVAVAFLSGANTTTVKGISPNSGSPSAGFDDVADQTFTGTSAHLLEELNLSDTTTGVTAGAQNNGVSEVFLGMLSLQATSSPNQTTTFTVGPYDPNNGNTATFTNLYDLDNNADPNNPAGSQALYNSVASTSFTVTTPEPGDVALLTSVAGLLLMRRARRIGRRVLQ